MDKQVATMTPWISSSAFKSMLLELITRGLHEREINLIYRITLLAHKSTAPFLVLLEASAKSERGRPLSNDLHGKEESNTQQWTSPIQ